MTRLALIGFAALALAGYGAATTAATTTARPCGGRDLTGSFRVIPGSPGAGSISYRLKLKNASTTTCYVSGVPQLGLIGLHGKALPTHVIPVPRGATAAKITLAPGHSAKADARFSPDVPGPGEGTLGQCEPKAYRLRVTLGGSSTTVPVIQPTPVCEHGTLQLKLFSAA